MTKIEIMMLCVAVLIVFTFGYMKGYYDAQLDRREQDEKAPKRKG